MYEYRCEIDRVIDGDTVDIHIDLGFGVWLKNERVRLVGIDAPESRTSDVVEKVFGLLAKQRVEELLPVGSTHILHSKDFKGKFGRILGDIEIGDNSGKTLTGILLEEHLAVEYTGQSKKSITEAHELNRNILINAGVVTLD